MFPKKRKKILHTNKKKKKTKRKVQVLKVNKITRGVC